MTPLSSPSPPTTAAPGSSSSALAFPRHRHKRRCPIGSEMLIAKISASSSSSDSDLKHVNRLELFQDYDAVIEDNDASPRPSGAMSLSTYSRFVRPDDSAPSQRNSNASDWVTSEDDAAGTRSHSPSCSGKQAGLKMRSKSNGQTAVTIPHNLTQPRANASERHKKARQQWMLTVQGRSHRTGPEVRLVAELKTPPARFMNAAPTTRTSGAYQSLSAAGQRSQNIDTPTQRAAKSGPGWSINKDKIVVVSTGVVTVGRNPGLCSVVQTEPHCSPPR